MHPIILLLYSMLSIPWGRIDALLDELTDGDDDDEAAIARLSEAIDDAVDFTVIPGVGDELEEHDYDLIHAIATWVWKRRGTKEERQANRKARKARRKARKAARGDGWWKRWRAARKARRG